MTGGSRGLGRATVEALAQRGVNVVLTYKTRLAEANEVVTRVEALGARAIALPFSAGEIDTFDAFVSAFQGALTELGADKFDYLVNNAGNASGMGFLNATEAEFDALYRIHVKGVFFLSQKLSAAAGRWRANSECLVRPHPHRDGEPGALCDHEIRGGNPDSLSWRLSWAVAGSR